MRQNHPGSKFNCGCVDTLNLPDIRDQVVAFITNIIHLIYLISYCRERIIRRIRKYRQTNVFSCSEKKC